MANAERNREPARRRFVQFLQYARYGEAAGNGGRAVPQDPAQARPNPRPRPNRGPGANFRNEIGMLGRFFAGEPPIYRHNELGFEMVPADGDVAVGAGEGPLQAIPPAVQASRRPVPAKEQGTPNKRSKLTEKPKQRLFTCVQRLQREYADFRRQPLTNVTFGPKSDTHLEWTATIIGPPGTPYENGVFFLDLLFTEDYPFAPPIVTFKTRIFHCNINSVGMICLDILGEKWSPAYRISMIFNGIIALLMECNPSDPLVGEIGRLYITDKERHDYIAREWTKRMAGVIPPEIHSAIMNKSFNNDDNIENNNENNSSETEGSETNLISDGSPAGSDDVGF